MSTASEAEAATTAATMHMLSILNSGSTALLISIGHRLSLFDALPVSPEKGITSDELATKAKLNERYVREWLSGLTCAKILEYDSDAKTFAIPRAYANVMTRQAYPHNLSVLMGFLPGLAGVEDKLIPHFQNGGGLSYDDYPRFHEVMAEESAQTVLSNLMTGILPADPRVTQTLEKGGANIIDVGCGSGLALLEMATKYPNNTYMGIDLCRQTVERATKTACDRGLTNITFKQTDIDGKLHEELRGTFDLATTFDAVHDQGRPDLGIKAVYDLLKPGGIYLMQDINASSHLHKNVPNPMAAFMYTVSLFHCMTVSLGQKDGMGLGTCWGIETAQQMVKDAGFTENKLHFVPADPSNFILICVKK
ncbi:methyltransferase type 12 [Phlyctochytrium arcticum]|nr:methyltransferase type 12 [Phlyctochytrium arcticum]